MTTKQVLPAGVRKFGFSFASGLAILGSLLLWKQKPIGPYVLGVAISVALLAVVAPRVLVPLERVLAAAFKRLTAVITFLILGLMYYLVMTPMGILLRILRQDLLEMGIDPDSPSYWREVDPSGPASRPNRPF